MPLFGVRDGVGDLVIFAAPLSEIGGLSRGWVEVTCVGVRLADFPGVMVEKKYRLNDMSSARMIIITPPIRSQRCRDMPDICKYPLQKICGLLTAGSKSAQW